MNDHAIKAGIVATSSNRLAATPKDTKFLISYDDCLRKFWYTSRHAEERLISSHSAALAPIMFDFVNSPGHDNRALLAYPLAHAAAAEKDNDRNQGGNCEHSTDNRTQPL